MNRINSHPVSEPFTTLPQSDATVSQPEGVDAALVVPSTTTTPNGPEGPANVLATSGNPPPTDAPRTTPGVTAQPTGASDHTPFSGNPDIPVSGSSASSISEASASPGLTGQPGSAAPHNDHG
jgi:hypothetical protein